MIKDIRKLLRFLYACEWILDALFDQIGALDRMSYIDLHRHYLTHNYPNAVKWKIEMWSDVQLGVIEYLTALVENERFDAFLQFNLKHPGQLKFIEERPGMRTVKWGRYTLYDIEGQPALMKIVGKI